MSEQKPYDASDEDAVSQRKKAAKRREDERLGALKAIMSHANGRAYVYWLLTSCHVYHTSFSSNALTMARSEGERNIGLLVLADLTKTAPDEYLAMIKENQDG
jgi:hypothetical protein